MPRDPHFNPTERILRLLEEFEVFKSYTDELTEKVLTLPQEVIDALDLPFEPTVYEFALERERMRKTHGQILATRIAQQNVRLRGGGQRIRKRGKFKPAMMDEIITAVAKHASSPDDDLKLIEEIKKDFFK